MDIYRKKINELINLYNAEPELKDIYVEGRYDKNLLEWFLTECQRDDIKIYEIKAIDIPDTILNKYGLNTESNSSRIIALAHELSKSLPSSIKVLCISDRDFYEFMNIINSSYFLSFTDYNSAELYMYNERTLRKFISLFLRGFYLKVNILLPQLTNILQELYLIRLTNETLRWGMVWRSITKRYIQINRDIKFDYKKYINVYLESNQRGNVQDKKAFLSKREELRIKLNKSPKFQIRGHDFLDLMSCVIVNKKTDYKFLNPEILQNALTSCLEAQDLKEEPLFKRILSL